jgi:hypothetical protein
MNDTQIFRHHLATLAYRVRYALKGAPLGFEDFEAGMEIRTPLATLKHINILLAYSDCAYRGESPQPPEELSWNETVEQFHQLLARLDNALQNSAPPEDEKLLTLYQGPLCDAMTHVGQLMMLRRLAGSPVANANYVKADIRAGQLGPNQKLPA